MFINFESNHETNQEQIFISPYAHPLPIFQGKNDSASPKVTLDGFYSSSPAPLIKSRKKNGAEKMEAELAKARAAIKKAVKAQIYRSNKGEIFVPRGSVYRNPAAFHQSHKEMVKRFKVWTYREGDQPLFHDGPINNIYAIEGQFMDEMSANYNPFQARHPDQAHVFFIPISVARVIRYVYKPIISPQGFSKDRLHRLFEDYVGLVARMYPYWNRSRGADHFMVSCHDWVIIILLVIFLFNLFDLSQAPHVSGGNLEHFKHLIRGLCNANTSEGFRPNRDVSIPEIYIPKGELGPRVMARPANARSILAFFAGRAHGRIRKTLFKHWKEKDNQVRVYETLPADQNYMKLMGQSKFCLCPSGWEVASPREVEAIYSGCVPVVISTNYSLPFSDVLDWNRFSIQIPVWRIPDIRKILEGIPEERYLDLYDNVRKVKRHFVLNRPSQPYDVLHMLLHSVWLRRLNVGLPN